MKYLLFSLSFFLFIGSTQAQQVAAKATCKEKVSASSFFDISLDFFSSKKEATNCKTASVSCSSTQASAQKVVSKTVDCKPENCNPTNCKPENCPPGCKPGSPECKMAVAAVADVAPNPDK